MRDVPQHDAQGKERHRVGEVRPPALVVTCSELAGGRHTRSCVRRALPHALVRDTSFRGVLCVDAAGDPSRLAEHVTRTCRGSVGRVTAVLAEVPSERHALVEAAVRAGVDEVAPGESFAFRVHKRGAHGYAEPTPELERAVGGAVWEALAQRDGTPPRVDLARPDVVVNAEVLGPSTLVGIVRRTWSDERAAGDAAAPAVEGPGDGVLEVDGSLHAGSGSIVRQAVAYAALTGRAIRVINARARRPHPGLRPQHTRAVEAVRDLVGGELEGATVGSRSFTFHPGPLRPSGYHRWDVGTAGSATTLALAVLPLVALHGRGVELEIHGGLFQDFAPSPFHL